MQSRGSRGIRYPEQTGYPCGKIITDMNINTASENTDKNETDIRTDQPISGSRLKKAILHLLAAAFFFSLMTFFVRVSGDLPTMQKAFFRNLLALIIATGSLIKNKIGFSVRKGNAVSLLMRCLFGTSGMIANFWAIDRLGIADANMLNKRAAALLTISDSFVTKHELTPEERQNAFTEMMHLAL